MRETRAREADDTTQKRSEEHSSNGVDRDSIRTRQGEGGGGESGEDGREAKPHRDEHQEQATARGAEPKIPR